MDRHELRVLVDRREHVYRPVVSARPLFQRAVVTLKADRDLVDRHTLAGLFDEHCVSHCANKHLVLTVKHAVKLSV